MRPPFQKAFVSLRALFAFRVSLNLRSIAMDVEVLLCLVEQKQVLKNMYTYWRYNRLKYIESGSGSHINDHGVINGDTARTHDEAVRDEDWPWERPGVDFPFLIRAGG